MPRLNKFLIFLVNTILFAVTLVVFLGFFFEIKIVKGNSMQPKLKSDQVIVIFKLAYGLKSLQKNFYYLRWARPKLNDIIVYKINNHFAVKRIVGIDKTPIEFFPNLNYNGDLDLYFQEDYKIIVGGNPIKLNAIQFRNLGGFAEKQLQAIPGDTVLAIGDNPDESYDSRDYGFVSIDSIYGKVLVWN